MKDWKKEVDGWFQRIVTVEEVKNNIEWLLSEQEAEIRQSIAAEIHKEHQLVDIEKNLFGREQRAIQLLIDHGYKTLEEVAKVSERRLMSTVKGFGAASCLYTRVIIRKELADDNLQLKEQEAEWKQNMRAAIEEAMTICVRLFNPESLDTKTVKDIIKRLFKKYNCEECHHHVTSKSDGKCVKCGEQVLVK